MDNFTNETVLELTGQVEAVVYRNDDNGYTVIEIAGEDKAITATGTMPMIHKVMLSIRCFSCFLR